MGLFTRIKRDYRGVKYKVPRSLCKEFNNLMSTLKSYILYSRDSDGEDRIWKRFNEIFAKYKLK